MAAMADTERSIQHFAGMDDPGNPTLSLVSPLAAWFLRLPTLLRLPKLAAGRPRSSSEAPLPLPRPWRGCARLAIPRDSTSHGAFPSSVAVPDDILDDSVLLHPLLGHALPEIQMRFASFGSSHSHRQDRQALALVLGEPHYTRKPKQKMQPCETRTKIKGGSGADSI